MKKVLIIRGSAIGDVVRCLPVASAIKSHFGKDCEVHWLVRKKLSKILEGNRFIDKILYFEDYKDLQFRIVKRIYRRRTNLNGLSSWLRFSNVKKLQIENYDAVINLHNILDAKIFSEMSGAVKHVAAPGINGVSNKKRNAVLQFLSPVGLLDNGFSEEGFTKEAIDYGWNFTGDELSKTDLILKENGCESNGYIVFVLGTTWESKNYPIENWTSLTKLLINKGKKIVCIGDTKDKEVLHQIKQSVADDGVIDLIGRTSLREMIMVLSKASVVIGGDTGPMHIAASLNVKTVALMNPTSAVSDAPFNNDGIVLTADYDCNSWYEVKCPKGICCMKYIAPEKVSNAVLSMI